MLTAKLGDTLLIMVEHQAIDKTDSMPYHYTLLFRDLPTGKTAELSFPTENHAVMAFATWLICDEPNIGDLEKFRTELYDNLPMGFLP